MRFSRLAVTFLIALGGMFGQAAPGAQQQARFEVRSAENAPGPGLTEATVSDSAQKVYLHDGAVVTGQDVTAATVEANGALFSVAIRFTAQGAEKMAAATRSHLGRPLAIVLDGKVISAPTVRATISDAAVITGRHTREEAERISAAILTR